MRLWNRQSAIAAGMWLLILGSWQANAQANSPAGANDHNSGSTIASAKPEIPLCAPAVPAAKKSPGGPSPHSVTLSWKASVPVSKSEKDAVKGYYIYRSQTSHKYADSDRLNPAPIAGTSCIDRTVAPHATYFYTIKSVTQGGEQSVLSEEVKAVVPFP